MNETTQPQPTRRGFCIAAGAAVAGLAWKPAKAIAGHVLGKAQVPSGAPGLPVKLPRCDPCIWMGGVGDITDPKQWMGGDMPRPGDSVVAYSGKMLCPVDCERVQWKDLITPGRNRDVGIDKSSGRIYIRVLRPGESLCKYEDEDAA